jgi:hypothetical protein
MSRNIRKEIIDRIKNEMDSEFLEFAGFKVPNQGHSIAQRHSLHCGLSGEINMDVVVPVNSAEAWASFLFDHPDEEGPLCIEDFPSCREAEVIEYSTLIFNDALRYLSEYSENQVARGLWWLLDASQGYAGFVYSDSMSIDRRIAFIESMHSLIDTYLLPRCKMELAADKNSGSSKLNLFTYMWWDISVEPKGGPGPGQDALIDEAIFRVIEHGLDSKHLALCESALHGLGHWRHMKPKVEALVDAFLKREGGPTSPELDAYARRARVGAVQ